MNLKNKIIIIAGPTCSGKTQLAFDLAKKINGIIINADSMQVYSEIPIVSAQPSLNLKNEVEHKLYGYISGNNNYSVGLWLNDAIEIINKAIKNKKIPIIVGGSGLYIKSLVKGISNIPQINIDLKKQVNELFLKLGKDKFYKLLKETDPLASNYILPSDKQRMIRAYEVFQQTKSSIIQWQNEVKKPPFSIDSFYYLYLSLERTELYQRCNERFLMMIEDGVIEEICYLKDQIKNINLPVMKALGVEQILEYINGNITLKEAVNLAQTATRQYAKRQITWFKNQIPDLNKHVFDPNLYNIDDILIKSIATG